MTEQDKINLTKQHIIQKIDSFDVDDILVLQKFIDKLYYIKKNKEDTIKRKNNIDKNTDKYKVLLKYVNGILQNIGKQPIDDLTDFKDIDRLDIINHNNILLLNSLTPILFKFFNKKKCGYHRKTKNISLNCLRSMCKDIGLKLVNRKITKNKKSTVETHLFYTIF